MHKTKMASFVMNGRSLKMLNLYVYLMLAKHKPA